MRLTSTHKDAFVRAVMEDVPRTDYESIMREKITSYVASTLPDAIKKLWDDKEMWQWVNRTYVYFSPACLSVEVPANGNVTSNYLPPELADEIAELRKKHEEQVETHYTLKRKIRAVIDGCSTRKRAVEMLPEFEKYLPADTGGVINRAMPVITNLVADLTQAGWPKDRLEA